jgi:ATPase subunit of ABC transporter with duplicated ATPase domains
MSAPRTNGPVPGRTTDSTRRFTGFTGEFAVSHGECGRSATPVGLWRGRALAGNVLLLDEPSNDLDVDTLRVLEDGLEKFPGCAVVISHDRWFLDRIATHILAFEGDSHVKWFEGNFQDYEADRRRRLGAGADQPHRIKYKPIRA